MPAYVNQLLGKSEKIELVTRQHWFVLLRETIKEILFAILILVVASVAIPFTAGVSAFAYFLLILPAVGLIYDYLIWWNREYIVTNHRVIQINGVLNKNVTDSSLEKVNDVKMSQSIFGRLFHYGDVEILTASEMGANLFQRISDPIKFKTVMLDAKERMGHELPQLTGEIRSDDVPAMLASLELLRKQGVLNEEEFQKKKAELLKRM